MQIQQQWLHWRHAGPCHCTIINLTAGWPIKSSPREEQKEYGLDTKTLIYGDRPEWVVGPMKGVPGVAAGFATVLAQAILRTSVKQLQLLSHIMGQSTADESSNYGLGRTLTILTFKWRAAARTPCNSSFWNAKN